MLTHQPHRPARHLTPMRFQLGLLWSNILELYSLTRGRTGGIDDWIIGISEQQIQTTWVHLQGFVSEIRAWDAPALEAGKSARLTFAAGLDLPRSTSEPAAIGPDVSALSEITGMLVTLLGMPCCSLTAKPAKAPKSTSIRRLVSVITVGWFKACLVAASETVCRQDVSYLIK
jgi:hypothetical protein